MPGMCEGWPKVYVVENSHSQLLSYFPSEIRVTILYQYLTFEAKKIIRFSKWKDLYIPFLRNKIKYVRNTRR